MAEEQPKKVEAESSPAEVTPPPPPRAPATETVEAPKDVEEEEKALVPVPADEKKPEEESKALVVVEKAPESVEEKSQEGSINRDTVLARVATEKRMSLIKAWEESEKSKADNNSEKISSIASWENSQIASVEAELKKIEEQLEKKKAAYVEKMKNKVALIHKAAEEKKAMIEAKKGEDLLKAEEIAAKYRATGTSPKKLLGCF